MKQAKNRASLQGTGNNNAKTKGVHDMIRVYNLTNDQEVFFDDHTLPEYAVRYCHSVESAKLASWFFNATPKEREILKITKGKHSICCGEWATKRQF